MKSKPVDKKKRDLKKTRLEILSIAFHEVFKNGFQGVSIDEIVKKTSLTKGAFYHHFPNKLSLGYSLVEEVIQPMILERWITPLNKFTNPLDGILNQLKVLIGDANDDHVKLGCPLNNLIQEMSPIDLTFKNKLEVALKLWIDEMESHLKRGQNNGYIRKDINTRQVAVFVVTCHEGFYGMLKGFSDPKAFQYLYESLKIYFKSLSN